VKKLGHDRAWGAGSRGTGERGTMKKWSGSGGDNKLGAYVPWPGAQRPRNIKTHLMFLGFQVWSRNISRYVPRGFNLIEEHKEGSTLCSSAS
jgi:hypothetical protein